LLLALQGALSGGFQRSVPRSLTPGHSYSDESVLGTKCLVLGVDVEHCCCNNLVCFVVYFVVGYLG
jgi:hypothetical protein